MASDLDPWRVMRRMPNANGMIAVAIVGVSWLFVAPSVSERPIMGSSESSASLVQREFVGTWRLVSFESRDSANAVSYPWGEDPQGLLVYDERGNMSVQLMRPHRPAFVSADMRAGTADEVRSAFEGYVGYFGTYTIDAPRNTVTHHISGSSFPNWVGIDQARYYQLEGQRLTLSTPAIVVGGRALRSMLVWERVR